MTEHAALDTPAETAGLIDYQDGAIVSRVLLKAAGGTVTLFAFDAGAALSEHTAPFDVLLQVVEGAADVQVGGKPHCVRADEVLRVPADVPHGVQARERFKMLLVMLWAG